MLHSVLFCDTVYIGCNIIHKNTDCESGCVMMKLTGKRLSFVFAVLFALSLLFSLSSLAAATYAVNLSEYPKGAGYADCIGVAFEEGRTVTVTATPLSGNRFVGWTENGNLVSTSARYTFMIKEERNLVAQFTSASNAYGYNYQNGGYYDANGNYIPYGYNNQSGGYYDANGNYIPYGYNNQGGYYDANGNYIPNGNQGGYYDANGNYIYGSGGYNPYGYYDVNGNYIPYSNNGTNTAYGYYDSNGNYIPYNNSYNSNPYGYSSVLGPYGYNGGYINTYGYGTAYNNPYAQPTPTPVPTLPPLTPTPAPIVAAPPVATAAPQAPIAAQQGDVIVMGIVLGEDVIARSEASAKGSSVGALQNRAEVTVLGYQNNFMIIQWNNTAGYAFVSADNMNVTFASPLEMNITGEIYAQSRMNTASKYRIETLNKGDTARFTGRYKQWWVIETSEGTGYVKNVKYIEQP